jgi:LacI family transcriptional regulator
MQQMADDVDAAMIGAGSAGIAAARRTAKDIETVAQTFRYASLARRTKLGRLRRRKARSLGGGVLTIADVAREAGVSVSTVSHVINGTRRVSPATARAVRAVIDATDYRPNVVARSLKTASTRSVGIAISAIANPYFSDIICAIETECARLGMMIFLSDTQDDPARELAVLTALHQRRVDGVILAPSADPEHRALRYLRATRLPCVLVDRTPDPAFDQVGVNNREAMHELVDYVARLGHRRIGYIAGHPGFETTLERIVGYRNGLEQVGLDFDERYLVTGNASTASADEAAHALLSLPDPPTAIVTGNNMATIGAMRAVRARGLSVPADISIAGFDDFEWADCFEPRLTLVAQPCEEIGRRAAFLLMERIAAPEGARRTVRLDATLRLRDSCARPR